MASLAEAKMLDAAADPQDPAVLATVARLRAAGYTVAAPVTKVHCLDAEYTWRANGFHQTYCDVGGGGGATQRCRVLDYAPRQSLQPHVHDLDELFQVTSGSILVYRWARGDPDWRQKHPTEKAWVPTGGTISVPAGTPHAIYAHRSTGCIFHETVGDFGARSTTFAEQKPSSSSSSESLKSYSVLGSDGKLRLVDAHVARKFKGKTVLCTCCYRGLGLEFVHQLHAAKANVVATCRTPARATALQEALSIAPKDKGHALLPLDISDAASVRAAVDNISWLHEEGLDVLINNAGISSPKHPVDPVLGVSAEDLANVFGVNVVGTVNLTQLCLPLLRAKATRLVCTLSSQLASIHNACGGAQGRSGGVASYRISRAASNMAMRCFAGELSSERFTVIAMSPGWVQTDMGSSGGRSAPLTPPESIRGMLGVLAGVGPDDSGSFRQFDGAELPW